MWFAAKPTVLQQSQIWALVRCCTAKHQNRYCGLGHKSLGSAAALQAFTGYRVIDCCIDTYFDFYNRTEGAKLYPAEYD